MNKVILLGRLTKDVEIKKTKSGIEVANFSIAVSRRVKGPDGKYNADFINCVAWRHTALFISKYFKKGDKIAITGSITSSTYEAYGEKRYKTEVAVEEVYFAGSKRTDQSDADLEEITDAELPFL